MRLAVATIQAGQHAGAFREVGETLLHGLTALGHDVELLPSNEFATGRRNIVLSPHLLDQMRLRPPADSILYNFEQAASPVMDAASQALCAYKMWSFDEASAERLRRIGIDVRVVPLGYVPELTRISMADEQDIDVLFYGSKNERRRRVLDELSNRGLRVVSEFGLYGAQRDALIARAKVVLSAHFYEPGAFEIVRVSYLLANKVCVVCEEGDGAQPFANGLALVPYSDLVEACQRLVRAPAERAALAARGFEIMLSRPETEALAEAAAELEASCSRRSRRATVSLCMIVRNEASNLEACVGPLRELIDDFVIVDTGSDDNTRDIGRRLGARVFEFPWCDDFSAARNESVKHARGEWIFWLDADDRVPASSVPRLRALFDSLGTENAAYVMQVVCPVGGSYFELCHPRLFRNDPRIRWEHRIHEQIAASVERAGGELRPTQIAIVHVGYTNSELARAKMDRNLRLIDLENEARPTDGGVLFNRARILLDFGRAAEALVAVHLCECCIVGPVIPRELFELKARAFVFEGRLHDALESVRSGLKTHPSDTALLFFEAELLAALGLYAEAETSLRAQFLLGENYGRYGWADRTIAAVRRRHSLAETLLLQARAADAEEHVRIVIEERPFFGPAWLTLGDVLLEQGKMAELEEACIRMEAIPGTAAALAIVRSSQLSRAGRHAEADAMIMAELRADPEHAYLLRARARLLYERGMRGTELIEPLNAALRTSPLCPRLRAMERMFWVPFGIHRETWSQRASFALGPILT